MPSGVMSTRDRMLARAGLGGVGFEAVDWAEGVVGVPGDGRGDGLAAERQTRAERWKDQSHCTNLRNDSSTLKQSQAPSLKSVLVTSCSAGVNSYRPETKIKVET